MSILSLRKVSKEFKVDDLTVIHPVQETDLEIEKGEFVIIIGRSGSGKTTLLNLAAGLIKPTTGVAILDNINLWNISDGRQSQMRNRKIGFIFQHPSLLPSLTALENVLMPASLGDKNSRDSAGRAEMLLATMGLSHRMRAYPNQLSSGEQRRVVIARALMNEPEILIADEPTSDLDVNTEKEVMALFAGLNESGVTILMVTHGLDLVQYAGRVLKMEGGQLSRME